MTNELINDYIAGAIGGAAGLFVGHPFDTTKVQLQTRQTSSPYKSTFDAIRNINQQGLVRGFFRGLGFPLVSYGVVNSVFFGVYGNSLRLMSNGDDSPSYLKVFVAGGIGGAAQLIVACPVDLVKVILQSQIPNASESGSSSQFNKLKPPGGNKAYFPGPAQCVSALFRQGGIRACYKGFFIQLYRDIPASAFFFLFYESFGDLMQKHNIAKKNDLTCDLMSGGLAGVLSWLFIMPLDVVKSQIQADYNSEKFKSITQCVINTYRRGGMRIFFTGALVVALRAFPVNAVIVTVYSQSLKYLNSRQLVLIQDT